MKTDIDFDIVVIGGGIVGLASAYKIQLGRPDFCIAVLEKEPALASHQTGRNSGVIHSGLYYKPGSEKAKTCAAGRAQLIAFAQQHNIPYEICGKIIVATEKSELGTLEQVFQNGLKNQIEGIEKIGPAQISKIEPFCSGIVGLRVPSAGIIDFTAVAGKLAELIQAAGHGSKVLTCHEVLALEKFSQQTKVVTNNGDFTARYIINCAGLQSDRVAKLDGLEAGMRIVPFRGDYYELSRAGAGKVKNLIYPVPNPAFPFLGVHFTRMIDGSVECGPNAVFSFKREGYGKGDFSFRDTWASLSYPGTWRLFLKHWEYGLDEYKRAFSKRFFFRQLRKLIPSLEMGHLKPGKSGVRAQALGPRGELIDDFKIERGRNSIHVLNAPSPAATAALAIGDVVNQIATEYFRLDSAINAE